MPSIKDESSSIVFPLRSLHTSKRVVSPYPRLIAYTDIDVNDCIPRLNEAVESL